MANDALVSAIKEIVTLAKAGKPDESYQGYAALFGSPDFRNHPPQDQRQALRLMVLAKGAPTPPSAAVIAAHRAALGPLLALVQAHKDPADHELLGVCHLLLGDEAAASSVFRAGLAIERENNPQSDLCGSLMKRVSLI